MPSQQISNEKRDVTAYGAEDVRGRPHAHIRNPWALRHWRRTNGWSFIAMFQTVGRKTAESVLKDFLK
jgi:hypothetical protein